MLIGSTSQGGILACPEVFFLPYMELRPFRVNAGGVHSYVYAMNDRTNGSMRQASTVMLPQRAKNHSARSRSCRLSSR